MEAVPSAGGPGGEPQKGGQDCGASWGQGGSLGIQLVGVVELCVWGCGPETFWSLVQTPGRLCVPEQDRPARIAPTASSSWLSDLSGTWDGVVDPRWI